MDSQAQAAGSKELLSPQEFAAASGFSLPTIRRYLEKGLLPKVQPGGKRGRVGIPRAALVATTIVQGPQTSPLSHSVSKANSRSLNRISGAAPTGSAQTTNKEAPSWMPKPRISQLIQCQHFRWRLARRDGVIYADGRSNSPNPGRHSLNTRDQVEALKRVAKLDLKRAVELGLIKAPPFAIESDQSLPLEDGRRRYETHIQRPIVVGGVKTSTAKRYRSVFDKFLPFAKNQKVIAWNSVEGELLNSYAVFLDKQGYSAKSIRNELVTIVQAQKWLIAAKHLVGCEPIKLQLRKVESERPFCYTTEQVAAMVEFCRAKVELNWLAGVIVALATTGLRIAELAGLRWSDIDLATGKLTLTDETGHRAKSSGRRQLKSGRSRSLPIHVDLAAFLAAIRRSDAYVFHGPRQGRLKPDTVRRALISDVLKPLAEKFPARDGEKGFIDGRLHSFRHYFASKCAMDPEISEYETMTWLGHADSSMVRYYFHVHDDEAQRRVSRLNLLGAAGQQRPGVHGVANIKKEAASQEQDPKIASSPLSQ